MHTVLATKKRPGNRREGYRQGLEIGSLNWNSSGLDHERLSGGVPVSNTAGIRGDIRAMPRCVYIKFIVFIARHAGDTHGFYKLKSLSGVNYLYI